MEPLQINITLGISSEAQTFLRNLAHMVGLTGKVIPESKPVQTHEAPAEATTQAEPAKPATAPESAPADAAPEEDTVHYTDAELRAIVKEVRDAGVVIADIRKVFADFGINSSPECKDEKRPELVERLRALKAGNTKKED